MEAIWFVALFERGKSIDRDVEVAVLSHHSQFYGIFFLLSTDNFARGSVAVRLTIWLYFIQKKNQIYA
jgi:hypothetical protein